MRMKNQRIYLAEAESGWDFSPRFDGRALDFVQVDLNSILYRNEIIISEFAKILNDSELSESFARKADRRKNAMYRYMKDCDGILRDYDFINKKQSGIISVASLLPFWAGIIDDRGVCEKILGRFGMRKGDCRLRKVGREYVSMGLSEYVAAARLFFREGVAKFRLGRQCQAYSG